MLVTIEERAASRVRSQRVRSRNEVAGVHDSSPTRSRARARDGTLGRSRWCFVLAPFAVGKRKPNLARPIRARVAPGNAQNSDRSASSFAPARRRVSHARVSRGYGEKRAWDAPRERARSARHRPSARFRIGGSEIANVAHLRSARRLFSSRGATRFARTRVDRGRDRRLLIGGLTLTGWRVRARGCARPFAKGRELCATFRERKGTETWTEIRLRVRRYLRRCYIVCVSDYKKCVVYNVTVQCISDYKKTELTTLQYVYNALHVHVV